MATYPHATVHWPVQYRPREIQLRQALFFTGASLSGAFSGLLATAIGNMGSKPSHPQGIRGMKGWRWIFILEGIFTVLVGVLTFFLSCPTAWTSAGGSQRPNDSSPWSA